MVDFLRIFDDPINIRADNVITAKHLDQCIVNMFVARFTIQPQIGHFHPAFGMIEQCDQNFLISIAFNARFQASPSRIVIQRASFCDFHSIVLKIQARVFA